MSIPQRLVTLLDEVELPPHQIALSASVREQAEAVIVSFLREELDASTDEEVWPVARAITDRIVEIRPSTPEPPGETYCEPEYFHAYEHLDTHIPELTADEQRLRDEISRVIREEWIDRRSPNPPGL